MSIPNIKAMFSNLNRLHFGGEIPDIPVTWSRRMTTTAGHCKYRTSGRQREYEPYSIQLSYQLFKNNGFDAEKVERTLIHEMVHAYLVHKYNERGHTARFQAMMTKITGEHKNHRCHDYNTEGLRRKQKKNIMCVCQRCGFMFWRARAPLRGRVYNHKKCGGIIKFTNVQLEEDNEKPKINIF